MPSKISPPPPDVTDDNYVVEMNEKWRPVFEKYDSNHDGLLSLDELKRLIDNGNPQLKHDLPDGVFSEIAERAVWDKNRQLTYKEFLKMVQASEMYADNPFLYKIMKAATNAVVPKTQRAMTLRRYVELYNCRPPPLFIVFITLIEIAVFLYYCVEFKELSAIGPVPINSAFIYNPRRRYEAWRFLSYMLIHAGAVHIFFNVLMQLVIGLPLEMVHKWWRVGLVYLLGVISGSLGSSISDPFTYLAGASGGVYSLIAAHLANVVIMVMQFIVGQISFLKFLRRILNSSRLRATADVPKEIKNVKCYDYIPEVMIQGSIM